MGQNQPMSPHSKRCANSSRCSKPTLPKSSSPRRSNKRRGFREERARILPDTRLEARRPSATNSRPSGKSPTIQAAAEANRLLQSFKHEDLPPIGLNATHVTFVIDTSGSMRNQITGQIHFGVSDQIRELLDRACAVSSSSIRAETTCLNDEASGSPTRPAFGRPTTDSKLPRHQRQRPEDGVRRASATSSPSSLPATR